MPSVEKIKSCGTTVLTESSSVCHLWISGNSGNTAYAFSSFVPLHVKLPELSPREQSSPVC